MLLFALLLLVILAAVALIGRRRSTGPIEIELRALWLAPCALILQLPLVQAWGGAGWRSLLFLASYSLLFLFCALNWRHVGARLLMAGFLLNFVVVASNGGFMPISQEAVTRLHPGTTIADWPAGTLRQGSKDIILPADQINLRFLSDAIVVPPPFPLPTAFSVGDLIILAGFAALFWQAFTASTESSSPGQIVNGDESCGIAN
ncbi:MAG: DUF5317 domain-containing protein [Caldilineales bacterium]